MRIIGLSGAIFLVGLLPGCGAMKVAYNQSPDLAYWYLDGYMDFNGEQSLQVKRELAKLQAWHRQTQLPTYVDALQKLRQQMPGDISAAQACEVYTDVRHKLMAISDHAEPAVVALAVGFDSKQLEQMERKFARGNENYREDYVEATPRDSRKKRYKEAVKRAEMLYGNLEDRQLAIISKDIDSSRFNAQLSYGERLRRQKDALQTLRSLSADRGAAADAEKTRLALRALLQRSINSPDVAYRSYIEGLTQDGCRMASELHNSTSAAQRKKAQETLETYSRDFQTLSARN